MKISTLLMMFPLLMPASVLAGTVLYTVIYLDGPEQVQTQLFGELSSNPDEATRQAQAVLKSPQWQANEQQLVTVYRAVVRAWELGVKKVPAVVFDDIDVVYGTADVARAVALRAQALGGQ